MRSVFSRRRRQALPRAHECLPEFFARRVKSDAVGMFASATAGLLRREPPTRAEIECRVRFSARRESYDASISAYRASHATMPRSRQTCRRFMMTRSAVASRACHAHAVRGMPHAAVYGH